MAVDTLDITSTFAVKSEAGHPTLNIENCNAKLGSFRSIPFE